MVTAEWCNSGQNGDPWNANLKSASHRWAIKTPLHTYFTVNFTDGITLGPITQHTLWCDTHANSHKHIHMNIHTHTHIYIYTYTYNNCRLAHKTWHWKAPSITDNKHIHVGPILWMQSWHNVESTQCAWITNYSQQASSCRHKTDWDYQYCISQNTTLKFQVQSTSVDFGCVWIYSETVSSNSIQWAGLHRKYMAWCTVRGPTGWGLEAAPGFV